jgi:hypothetical protein
MGLRPETVLETADRPATPMIDGRRLGSCNPNGFGIQPYSGGAVSMNGTVIANATMNNNGPSGLLLHGDASNVEPKNLITTGSPRLATRIPCSAQRSTTTALYALPAQRMQAPTREPRLGAPASRLGTLLASEAQ